MSGKASNEVGHLNPNRFPNKLECVQLINYFVVPTFLSFIYSSLIYGCQLERVFERGLEKEQTLARGCKDFAKIGKAWQDVEKIGKTVPRSAKRCKKRL